VRRTAVLCAFRRLHRWPLLLFYLYDDAFLVCVSVCRQTITLHTKARPFQYNITVLEEAGFEKRDRKRIYVCTMTCAHRRRQLRAASPRWTLQWKCLSRACKLELLSIWFYRRELNFSIIFNARHRSEGYRAEPFDNCAAHCEYGYTDAITVIVSWKIYMLRYKCIDKLKIILFRVS